MWDKWLSVNRMIKIDSLASAFVALREKNYVYHGEAHDYWEIVYVIEGVAGIAADERIYECPAGSIIFHKPNEFHRIWNIDERDMKFMIISFSTKSEYALEKLSDTVMSVSEVGMRYIKELQRIIEDGYPIIDLMPYYFREAKNPSIMPIFINTLELLMYECSNTQNTYEPQINQETIVFSNAVRRMKECIFMPIKAQQIADDMNISLSNLKRVFNRYAMMGVHEYFLAIKITYAKDLLLQDIPVYIVAEKVGFSNQNNFSATFKREVGLTPTQWIKSLNRK